MEATDDPRAESPSSPAPASLPTAAPAVQEFSSPNLYAAPDSAEPETGPAWNYGSTRRRL
eukprot:5668646-Lingulodinium_polyedra.AAC.1